MDVFETTHYWDDPAAFVGVVCDEPVGGADETRVDEVLGRCQKILCPLKKRGSTYVYTLEMRSGLTMPMAEECRRSWFQSWVDLVAFEGGVC